MTSGTYIATMLILDRERRKRRGKGQANAQVSFEVAKRALIGYCYRCKYTSVHTPAYIYFRGIWACICMDWQSLQH